MRRVITILLLVTFPASVAAQTNLPRAGEAMNANPCATSDCAVSSTEPQEYDFEDDEIEGRLIKPNESWIPVDFHKRPSQLIRIRADFVGEILSSVDHI